MDKTETGLTAPEKADGEQSVSYTPLAPFDTTAGESFSFYDNMQYVCDTDLCSKSMIKLESGNVTKNYRIMEGEPIKLGGDLSEKTDKNPESDEDFPGDSDDPEAADEAGDYGSSEDIGDF